MIPYLEWKTVEIGPLTLYVWGFFVALGFIFAAYMAGRLVKKRGLKPKLIFDLTVWMMLAGFIGGRLGYIFFYNPRYFLEYPLEVFRVWDGGSSLYGGIILAVIVGIIYLKKKRVDVFKYADSAIFGLPFGLWIGRIGCWMIHDHPGTETDFFLGMQYPDGIVRHDHGFYLSLNGFILALVFLWLARKERPTGTYIAAFSIWYGVIRFCLDFWRIADVTYLGLTPAQYFSIILFSFGLWLIYKMKKNKK